MFSSDPSEYEEIASLNLLEPKLESSKPSHFLSIALTDHNYCARYTEEDAADHSFCKLEPGDLYIELELEANENVAVGTSELRHPRIRQKGVTNESRIPSINDNQKVRKTVPKRILAGPLCWKRRQPRKRRVQNAALSKKRLAGTRKIRRPIKKKTNKLHLQCKVQVLDARDTLYCHQCGEWSPTPNDLLCHMLMIHDIDDTAENQQTYLEKSEKDIRIDKNPVTEHIETENQVCLEKSKTENQSYVKSTTTKCTEPSEIFKEEYLEEDLYDNIFPCANPSDKSQKENKNVKKVKTKSKRTKKSQTIKKPDLLMANDVTARAVEPFQTDNQSDVRSTTTKCPEPAEMYYKEEYLEEDLYDTIIPYERKNLQMYPSDQSQIENQNVNRVKTKSKCTEKSKTSKKDLLMAHDVNETPDGTFQTENKEAHKKSEKLISEQFHTENQSYVKSTTTKSNEPIEIFKEEYLDEELYDHILPCENENLQMYPRDETETENQNVKRVETKSKCTNKTKTKKPDVLTINTRKPDVPYKILLRHLKAQKENNCDKIVKYKAAPKSDQISDVESDIESHDNYKIKKTNSKGPNILILPCKKEPQTENQTANKIMSAKSKKPSKTISSQIQQNPQGSLSEKQSCKNRKIKSERSVDKPLHRTNNLGRSIKLKQKLDNEQHSTDNKKLISCKVEIPDVKETLYCQECGEWSVTAENLLYHTLMKHSIDNDMYQSDVPFQAEDQDIDTLSDHIESQKENQNYNTIKSTKSNVSKQKRKVERQKRKRSKKQESIKVFACDLCDKSFARQWSLGVHKQVHKTKPFSCEICGHMFDSEEKCATHEKSHLGIKKIVCDVCNQRFDAKNDLEMHKSSHRGGKPYTCDACENSFASKAIIREHLQICREFHNGKIPSKNYKCEECDFKAHKECQVKSHMRDVHGNDVFICDTCDRQFNTKAKLESHLLVHSTNKSFKCRLCEYRCVTERKLKYHIINCHLATKKYTCRVCSASFKTPTCVKRHELIHSGIKAHTCPICNRRFTLKTTLNSHIMTHSTDSTFSCVMCGTQFKTRYKLTGHLDTHKENRNIYVCAHCDEVVFLKKSFLHHLKSCGVLQGLPKKIIKQTSTKLTYCEQCNKTFTYNYYVTKHQNDHNVFCCSICNMQFYDKQRCETHELKHAGLKAYGCELCNKRFICKNTLSDHMNKHKNIKPHKCNLCPQRFAYINNMRAHMRNFHTKIERIKLHECGVCHKKYFTKTHLKRHKETHTKVKPCPCKKCGKRFKDKYQLRLHIRTHNTKKPYSCNICKKKVKTKGLLKDHIFFAHERYTIKLSCDICNRVFCNKVSLKSHFKEKHKHCMIFPCDACDKGFYTRQYLNRHKSVHDETVLFPCGECKLNFKEKFNLVKHLSTHTEKPYICEVCDEPFKSRRMMQYHAEIHDAIKQLYSCQYCTNTYTDKNSVRRHEKNSCPKALRNRKRNKRK